MSRAGPPQRGTCPAVRTREEHVPGRPAATGDMSSCGARTGHNAAPSNGHDQRRACPGPARRNGGHVQLRQRGLDIMPLCPTATTNEGHVPGRPAATRDMSSRADQGRACPGAACTIYPSNRDFKKVAAKLGIVERACAENTVSHWNFNARGSNNGAGDDCGTRLTPLARGAGCGKRRIPGRDHLTRQSARMGSCQLITMS